LFIDIGLTKHPSYGKAKFWLLAVDNATDFCWSLFLKTKDKTVGVMIDLVKELNDNTR